MPGVGFLDPVGGGPSTDAHAPRGWYADPDDPTRIRYWAGQAWTRHVAERPAAPQIAESVLRRELEDFVDHCRGRVDDAAGLRTRVPAYLDERYRPPWHRFRTAACPVAPPPRPDTVIAADDVPAAPPDVRTGAHVASTVTRPEPTAPVRTHDRTTPPPVSSTVVGEPAIEPRVPTPEVAPTIATQLPPPTVIRERGPSLWGRVRGAVTSDLAVHGLAYLGVLLVFAGVFGLLVFSWGEVGSAVQPAAEVVLPAALLGTGTLLTRRGSVVVGRSLVLVGGAVIPLVVIAAVADGSPVPPDAHHAALVAWAAAAFFGTAVVLTVWTRFRPDSVLRHLVAPMLWFGVAMTALAVRSGEVIGDTVARPSSGQVALVLLAIAATAWWARLRPRHPLSRSVLWASVVGLGVFTLLGTVLATREPWPLGAVVVGALAVVVGLEAVSELLPAPVVAVGQVLGTAAALAVLGARGEPAWAGVAGVPVLLAVTEWEGRRRPGRIALTAAATGVAGALAVASLEPWPCVVGFAAATVWAIGVHVTTRPWFPARVADAVAGLLPLGVAAGLFRALDPAAAATTTAATVAAVAVLCRLLAPDDRLARWWVPSAALAVLVLPPTIVGLTAAGPLALTAGLGVVAVAVAPLPGAARLWLVGAGLVETAVLAGLAWEVSAADGAVVLATVGFSAVVVAVRRLPLAGHLSIQGHLAGLAAVLLAVDATGDGRGWPVAIGLMGLVGGLAVTSWRDRDEPAPVVGLLSRVADGRPGIAGGLRRVLPALTIAGLPVAIVSVVDCIADVLDDAVRTGLLLSAVALLFGATTWIVTSATRVVRPLEGVAVATAVAAIPLTSGAPAPATAAGAVVALVCLAPAPVVRWRALSWLGWVATGYVAVRAAEALGLAAEWWGVAAMAWSSALGLGALIVDRVMVGPRSRPGWIRERSVLAPATVGAVAFPIALSATFALDPTTWAWSAVAAAIVVAVGAALTGAGVVTGLSWLLVTLGASELVPFSALEHPESLVAAGAVMAAASAVLAAVRPGRGWACWDLPPLVVGTGVVLVALVAAVPESMWSTWLAAGGVGLLVSITRREAAWAVGAVILINAAAAVSSTAWLTTSLALTSLAATVGAVVSRGLVRGALRAGGVIAALGAFEVLLVDLGLQSGEGLSTSGVVVASLVGGGILLGLALAARVTGLRVDWVLPWSLGAGAALGQAVVHLGGVERQPSGLGVACGLLAAAAAAAIGAAPLRAPGLRTATVYLAAGASTAAVWATEPPLGPVSAALGVLGVSLAVIWLSVRRRRVAPWAVPLLHGAVSSTALAPVVAGLSPGHVWLAIGLTSASTVSTLLATGARDGGTRGALQMVGVLAAVAAVDTWFATLGWVVVAPELAVGQSFVTASALGSGVAALSLVSMGRWRRVGRDWIAVWAFGAALIGAQGLLSVTDVERLRGGLAVGGGLLLFAGPLLSLLARCGVARSARPPGSSRSAAWSRCSGPSSRRRAARRPWRAR